MSLPPYSHFKERPLAAVLAKIAEKEGLQSSPNEELDALTFRVVQKLGLKPAYADKPDTLLAGLLAHYAGV